MVQVLEAAPVPQRIDLHAQHDRQLVGADDAPGIGGGIGNLHPAAAGAAVLPVDVIDHLRHAGDLCRDCAAVVIRSGRPGTAAQQLVVYRQAARQAQPALVRPVDPVDVRLLVHERGEPGPDVEVRPAAAGRMAKLGIDVDQAAVDGLAVSQRLLHTLGMERLAPEGVAAEGKVRHKVRVKVGKAPQGCLGLSLPVIAPQRDAWRSIGR